MMIETVVSTIPGKMVAAYKTVPVGGRTDCVSTMFSCRSLHSSGFRLSFQKMTGKLALGCGTQTSKKPIHSVSKLSMRQSIRLCSVSQSGIVAGQYPDPDTSAQNFPANNAASETKQKLTAKVTVTSTPPQSQNPQTQADTAEVQPVEKASPAPAILPKSQFKPLNAAICVSIHLAKHGAGDMA